MSTCKVHNIRFYKPKPKAIYCMAYNKSLKLLAVSRSDASLELWGLKNAPTIQKRFPCNTTNYSIEGLAWAGNKLFSVGLHALLIEYDLTKLSIKSQTSITGQTAFCLDVSPSQTHIAIGTELGFINIFTIDFNDIVFDKFLDKQEGRILCLKYDATGEFIISGSMDTIRVWNVHTGHALHKMTTGRSEAKKETIVWCLGVTRDFTIISGDSRGKLTFWDGRIGAQIESYQSHRADILSLCLSDDEKILYCAGIDSIIASYELIEVKEGHYRWVKSIQRRVHDHDVRALMLSGNRLYSGGVDGYLACSYQPPKTLVKYPPVLPDCVQVTGKNKRFALLKYPKYLELWQLGTPNDKGKDGGSMISLAEDPKKLLIVQKQVKSDIGTKREGIATSTMSSSGDHIAFSTSSTLRVFKFDYDNVEQPILTPCDLNERCSEACVNMIFTPNGEQLIVASSSGDLLVMNVQHAQVTLSQCISLDSYKFDTITFLLSSPCGRFLLAADASGTIVAWQLNAKGDKSWSFYCKPPRYACDPTAMSIQAETMHLIVAYSDHKIAEYNLRERKVTDLGAALEKSKNKMFNKNFPIRSITFDPRNNQVILLNDDSNIYIVNKNKRRSSAGAMIKVPKTDNSEHKATEQSSVAVHAIKKYKHLVHLGWLSNDELVAVEVSPFALLEQLPPGFKQNTFGTK